MNDLEKAIKGTEICLSGGKPDRCRSCPYHLDGCDRQRMLDTLALLKEQEWISVKDRLPNCNGCYLVWRPNFYTDKGMPSICYFDGSNTWHDSYGVDFTRLLNPEDVTHWMELPGKPTERR